METTTMEPEGLETLEDQGGVAEDLGIGSALSTEPTMIPIAKAPEKESLCPFGCMPQTLDENGYCFHLVGFSNDKKTFEPTLPMIDRHGNENGYQQTGLKGVRLPVLTSDKCVKKVFFDGKNRPYHKALSWRVYRKEPLTSEAVEVVASKSKKNKK